MPATVFDEDPLVDPDELKMPESPDHRRAVDLIGLAATRLLDPSAHQILRDMNWYPPDGGTAVAPDVMILPAGALVAPPDAPGRRPKSYRQDQLGGPPASVVVEVPSDSDGFLSLRSKAHRYGALGTVVYIVVIEGPDHVVLRLAPGEEELAPWTGHPIPELGGLHIDFPDGQISITTPDGTIASSDSELVDTLVEEAEARAEALAEQLRALGAEPEA